MILFFYLSQHTAIGSTFAYDFYIALLKHSNVNGFLANCSSPNAHSGKQFQERDRSHAGRSRHFLSLSSRLLFERREILTESISASSVLLETLCPVLRRNSCTAADHRGRVSPAKLGREERGLTRRRRRAQQEEERRMRRNSLLTPRLSGINLYPVHGEPVLFLLSLFCTKRRRCTANSRGVSRMLDCSTETFDSVNELRWRERTGEELKKEDKRSRDRRQGETSGRHSTENRIYR